MMLEAAKSKEIDTVLITDSFNNGKRNSITSIDKINAENRPYAHVCHHVKHLNYRSPLAVSYQSNYTFEKQRRGVEVH